MALTNKLTAIADAIRAKDGSTALLTLDEMPTAIAAIETGGGGDSGIPEEAFVISGDCGYRFTNSGWNWFIENYGNKITTENITNIANMFYNCATLESIPFTLNLYSNTSAGVNFDNAFYMCYKVPKISLDFSEEPYIGNMKRMFASCKKLTEISDIYCNYYASTNNTDIDEIFAGCESIENLPYIYNLRVSTMTSIFKYCYRLRTIPEDYFDTWDFKRVNSYQYANSGKYMFAECKSLRTIPEKLFNYLGNDTVSKSSTYSFYSNTFENCSSLDELTNLPLCDNIARTGNIFSSTFVNCYRLKDIKFRTNEDGSAKEVQWKSQTIALNTVGITNVKRYLLDYNSGITADKEVTDDATYQALKDNPDWFSCEEAYSRYNHDSAVNTINSLPDTSAYLATAGGTNTIKFLGAAGSATDGGAINTLTEEEIAVAAAKGWTVTFA